VLFSNVQVASFIDRYFEPAWESTRPVPIVRIDFGNGTVVTRTLHGNIATEVCSADGEVLDILPGIYTPGKYVEQLNQFRLLANYAGQEGPARRPARMLEYHKIQAAFLRKKEKPAQLVDVAPMSKAAIESRVKAVLVSGPGRPELKLQEENADLPKSEDLASWKLLADDTRLNESLRRLQIHELLFKSGLVRPEVVQKPLYRDILHADLEDPYLGLGSLLFATYPFKDR
jgi:hypothetical protein